LRVAHRRQADPDSPQPLVDAIEYLAAIGRRRPERDAERHRDLRAVLDPVRPGHGKVEPVAGGEREDLGLLLVRVGEDQVAVAASVELLQLALGEELAVLSVEQADVLLSAYLQQEVVL